MRTLKARWIFPGTSPPIRDGCVLVEGGKIVRVDSDDPAFLVDLDLGAVAIVPGFVNAHTHLELAPIPPNETDGPENELDWLGRVIQSRLSAPEGAGPALTRRHVQLAVNAGTTALGDITTAGQSWNAVTESPVWGTVFTEVLGLSPFRADQTWRSAVDWINALPPSSRDEARTRPGLSPHAPYSTSGQLYRDAAASGLPLATHLGELPEEREFLSRRSGPLRRFVETLGAWNEAWMPIGPAPIDYIDADPNLARADWIIAHGNIFEPSEFARLVPDPAQPTARRIAVAYCPRTHARFGHPPHPFRAMLDAGVVVCLGTDSLASSPTLSILDEVRFLHRRHPQIAGATLLKMATIHGAWGLRIDHKTGSLEPGKSADMAVLALVPGEESPDPHTLWLKSATPPLATMFQGEFVAGRWA